MLGFELLPRIRNWHDLTFYRPDAATRYEHIDALFGDDVIDWDLIDNTGRICCAPGSRSARADCPR